MLTFPPSVSPFWMRSDEVLTLETSALRSFYCGQITFVINSADKLINQTFVYSSLRRDTTVSLESNPLIIQTNSLFSLLLISCFDPCYNLDHNIYLCFDWVCNRTFQRYQGHIKARLTSFFVRASFDFALSRIIVFIFLTFALIGTDM